MAPSSKSTKYARPFGSSLSGAETFNPKTGVATQVTKKETLEKTINWKFMEPVYNQMEGYVMDTTGKVQPFYRFSGIPAEAKFQKRYVDEIVKRKNNGEFVKWTPVKTAGGGGGGGGSGGGAGFLGTAVDAVGGLLEKASKQSGKTKKV